MSSKVICKAEYNYGSLVYLVKVVQRDQAFDWKTEETVEGEFYFVEYTENTLPKSNSVGSFNNFNEAFEWANSKFGKLKWDFTS